jgi:hypothetical protein
VPPQTIPILRQRLEGANTDGERVHALLEVLEQPAAIWGDALKALSYESPTSNLASYYFHVLLKVPCEGGRSNTDPAYWLGVLQTRGIKASDPLRKPADTAPSRG